GQSVGQRPAVWPLAVGPSLLFRKDPYPCNFVTPCFDFACETASTSSAHWHGPCFSKPAKAHTSATICVLNEKRTIMLRLFLLLSVRAVELFVALAAPGQVYAQRMHGGFSRGFHTSLRSGFRPGFHRGVFGRPFGPGPRTFRPGFRRF